MQQQNPPQPLPAAAPPPPPIDLVDLIDIDPVPGTTTTAPRPSPSTPTRVDASARDPAATRGARGDLTSACRADHPDHPHPRRRNGAGRATGRPRSREGRDERPSPPEMARHPTSPNGHGRPEHGGLPVGSTSRAGRAEPPDRCNLGDVDKDATTDDDDKSQRRGTEHHENAQPDPGKTQRATDPPGTHQPALEATNINNSNS